MNKDKTKTIFTNTFHPLSDIINLYFLICLYVFKYKYELINMNNIHTLLFFKALNHYTYRPP